MTRKLLLSLAVTLTLPLFTTACVAADKAAAPVLEKAQWPFAATEVARFDEPWAMSFLPDGSLLVSEKAGTLEHVDLKTGKRAGISGLPKVAYGGQGGFGDVLPHPQFARNQLLYVSYAEPGEGDMRGAAVARARLALAPDGSGRLEDLKVIWRQTPKVDGKGHFGHRLAFGPDGKLWITSSERQQFDPAQDMGSNLGKIVRLNATLGNANDKPERAEREEIAAGDNGAKLGLALRPLDPTERRQAGIPSGLLVEDAGGPAQVAGVQPGDVLLSVNGKPVNSVEQVRDMVGKSSKSVALLIQRGDDKIFIPVRIG